MNNAGKEVIDTDTSKKTPYVHKKGCQNLQ